MSRYVVTLSEVALRLERRRRVVGAENARVMARVAAGVPRPRPSSAETVQNKHEATSPARAMASTTTGSEAENLGGCALYGKS